MKFKYQRYYLRLCIVACLVIALVMVEELLWNKFELGGNINVFILMSIVIMFFVVNLIFKYFDFFVIDTGELISNEDGSLEIILSNKKYKLREITDACFYTFHIYGVLIGEIYVEFKDERSNKKRMKIFSEDLRNAKFKETSLFKVMHANIPEMKELKD